MDWKQKFITIKDKYLYAFLCLAGLLLLWQVFTEKSRVPDYILPSPRDILSTFHKSGEILFENALVTLFETLSGFIIGALFGFFIAVCICLSKFLQRMLYPILILIQSIPKIALAPLFIIWLGFGITPKIAVTALVSFFPVLVNTLKGLNSIKQDLMDLMILLHATKMQILFKVRIPSSLPYFCTSLKISAVLSVVGAIVGEFVGADQGLGYLIMVSSTSLNTSLMFSAIILIGIIGLLLSALINPLESILVPWYKKIGHL